MMKQTIIGIILAAAWIYSAFRVVAALSTTAQKAER